MRTKQEPNVPSSPHGWSEVELRQVVEVNPESLGIGTPQDFVFKYIDISSVTSGVINWETITDQIFQSSPSRARRVVHPNDVLLCTVRPGLQAHAFADWQESEGYVCSTGFAVLRASPKINSRFLYHLIFSEIVASQIRKREVGSNYPAVNETDVRELIISLPATVNEQRKIAEVIDIVDRLITLTDRHIAKLKLAKAGLLHDLLTRGIDEHGELRDPIAHPEQFKETGTAISRVPKEWNVQTIGNLAESIIDGPFGSNLKTEHYVNEPGVRVIRLQNIEIGRFDDSDKAYISNQHANSLSRYEVVPRDLLIASLGDENHPIARACIYPEELAPGINKADCFRSRMHPELALNPYIMHVLNCPSTRSDITLLAQGVTRDRLNSTTIKTVKVRVPPVQEQAEIVNALQIEDGCIHRKETRLEKLKLLKKGLMADLLTGRVRVNLDNSEGG